MTRATGVHLGGDAIRTVCLEHSQTGPRLCALAESTLPSSLSPSTFPNSGSRDSIVDFLKATLTSLDIDTGTVIPSLGRTFYHIQKIPLEVASDEDRKEQVRWEAAQTLISPLESYLIDYYPAGRSAFWIAIRKEIQDFITSTFISAGYVPGTFLITPVALYHACELARVWLKDRNAAILLERSELAFVAGDRKNITSAETIDIQQNTVEGPKDTEAERLHKIKGWVTGDRSTGKSSAAYQEVYLSGEPKHTQALVARLKLVSPELKSLEPFDACDIRGLTSNQENLLNRQSAFAVAAGLAYRGLKEETQ